MQKEFVTYEIADGLSDLGFKQACHGFYHDGSEDNGRANCAYEFVSLAGWSEGRSDTKDLSSHDFIIVAPLWQQAIDWLWKEKGVFIGFSLGSEYITCWQAERYDLLYFKLGGNGGDHYEAMKWALRDVIKELKEIENGNTEI